MRDPRLESSCHRNRAVGGPTRIDLQPVPNRSTSSIVQWGLNVPELHIALEEGFEGDDVVVDVDGDEVYQGQNVHTRYQIGLADTVDVTVEAGTRDIRVRVATREIDQTFRVEVADHLWFGVSISEEDQLRERTSAETFRYA